MMNNPGTIRLDARKYEGQDDCLQAASNDFIAQHPALHGWDLSPRWEDDQRDAIVLTVPAWSLKADHYIETRFTADRSKPGSRWEPTGPASDEVSARAQYEILKTRPGVDVRIVRLDWPEDVADGGDMMPLAVVVAEATGAS